jgi:hypothetical protein
MTTGGVFIRLFFPHRVGAGLDFWALTLLIPIWSAGGIGIVLLLIGWVAAPNIDPVLDPDWSQLPRRKDGRMISPLIRFLASFTLVLFLLAIGLIWIEPDEVVPVWQKALVMYVSYSVSGVLLYLLNFYSKTNHRATSTYLNHFGPLIAVILAPLSWPLLILLNMSWTTVSNYDRKPPP